MRLDRLPFLLILGPLACVPRGGAVVDADADGWPAEQDCDDRESTVHPEAAEVCDTLDNDCDGLVDDADDDVEAPVHGTDRDHDGYGNPEEAGPACVAPLGTAPNVDDCDDENAEIHPGAEERWYDGVDQDCDGGSDWDQDGDGYDSHWNDGQDCDDRDPSVHPGAGEIWYDGVDQDCDALSDFDQDRDGSPSSDYGGDDCDDLDFEIRPGAVELWYDGVDQDCDGGSDYDQDRDGEDASAWGGDDCDDLDPQVRPGAVELWYDGVDQDCDGGSDYDQDGDGHDASTFGGDDCDDTRADANPDAAELWYDGVDQDCDGSSDYDQDGDGEDASEHGGIDCDDTDPAMNHVDRDGDTWSPCDGDCDEGNPEIHPGRHDAPDGIDNDCNGIVDDVLATYTLNFPEDFAEGFLDGQAVLGEAGDGELTLAPRTSSFLDAELFAELPGGTSNAAVLATGGRIYVAGGLRGDDGAWTYLDDVLTARIEDDGSLSAWTESDPLPAPIMGSAVASDGHCLVLAGGYRPTGTRSEVFTSVIQEDGSLGALTAQAPLPSPRTWASATALGGTVFVIGGWYASNAYNTVYYARLDPDCSIDSWAATTSLPGSRYHLSTVAAGGRLYVLGGHYYYGRTNVWSAAPTVDGRIASWSTEASLPEGLHGQGAVSMNGQLVVAGGNSESDTLDTLWTASLDASGTLGAWVESERTLVEARAYHGLVAWNGVLYELGGAIGDLTTSWSSIESRTDGVAARRVDEREATHRAFASRYAWTLDLGADAFVSSIGWDTTLLSDGVVDLSYRLAAEGDVAPSTWLDLDGTGFDLVLEDARYLQFDVALGSASGSGASLDQLVVTYR